MIPGRIDRNVFRKSAALSLWFFLALGTAFGQIVIDNGARPKNPNAGRIIPLQEVLRIREDGDKIIFKNPMRLALGTDESLFFIDGEHLYRFDRNGRFLFQYANSGEGPGECRYVDQFLIAPDKIQIQSWIPPKIMDFDLRGKLLKDTRTKISGPFWYMKRLDGKIYGIRDEIRYSEAIHKTGLIETPYTIYEIADDFQGFRKIADISVLHYIQKAHWARRVMLDFTGQGHFLYIIRTAEYQIEKLDLRTGRIERVFRRKYPRRKIPPEEAKEEYKEPGRSVLVPPPLFYSFDIGHILVVKDQLWVVTFTERDNGHERLIDVFDPEGSYLDSFFIKFPPGQKDHEFYWSLVTDDGFLYIPEVDEDGLFSIGKYKIPGLAAPAVAPNK